MGKVFQKETTLVPKLSINILPGTKYDCLRFEP